MNKNGWDLSTLDNIIIRVSGQIQSGWIDLGSSKIKKGDLIYKLLYSKAALKDIQITPGETTYFLFKDLVKEFNLDFFKLHEEYYKLTSLEDGVFIADTYKLPLQMSEEEVVKTLFRLSMKKHKSLSEKIFGSYSSQRWFHIVTVASIIEKESGSKEEMKLVSSVIENRLKRKMPLQMDGTLNYKEFSHTVVTPKMIREDLSDYNTYKRVGVPSNPVCMVSVDAIIAAIHPAKTDYLYFYRTAKGEHTFAKTYREHTENIRKYRP